MKAVEVLDGRIAQAEFAEIVGLSEARVSQMLAEGILPRGGTGLEWIGTYCDHLREVAAGRMASGGLDLATERARLAREQADRIAMQNAVTRGELVPANLLEQVLTATASKIVGVLDAVPSVLRRRTELTAGEIELVAAEIAKARNTVAGMSLADIEVSDDKSDDEAPVTGNDGDESGSV